MSSSPLPEAEHPTVPTTGVPPGSSPDGTSDGVTAGRPDGGAAGRPVGGAAGRPGGERGRAGVRPRRAVEFAIVAGYLLLAIWIMLPFWRDPANLYPATNTSDPEFFDWALLHATRIFTHGENPFFTPQLNAPLGVSMIANTGLLGLAVPLVPVTLLFGPAASLALIITAGLAGTAAAWYYVISRHVVGATVPAVLGGLFCGFAPGMVNHANAHPNIVAQFLIPLIVFQVLALRSPAPGRVWRRGVLLGLLITAQAFLNEELLFLTALAMGIFVAGYALSRPREVREGIRPFLAGIAVAAGTAALLLGYPLWYQFVGPQHYRGLPSFILGYGSDLASYPAFAKLSLLHGDGTLANQPEENSFLGWPLLLALSLMVGWLWRRPAVRALVPVGLIFAVLSLGPTVTYRGHPIVQHAPWSWLNKLPLFDTVVPTRLALVVVPVVGLLLAMCLDSLRTAPRTAQFAWVAVLSAVLVPIAPRQIPVVQRPAVPDFFTSGTWHRYVRSEQAVLNADASVWNGGIQAMQWDTATRQGFRVVGGYFLGPDSSGRGTYGPQYRPTAGMLWGVASGNGVPDIGQEQRANLVADARYWNLAIIVLAPDAPRWRDLSSTLNRLIGPGISVDDVQVWDLRGLR